MKKKEVEDEKEGGRVSEHTTMAVISSNWMTIYILQKK